ncbi:hypothetical protein BX616_010878 [Lobosporangium transversale]|uniref:Uncharacterized protein n=1 Tax=Lobosporangium transversale TaxID=64571 RepID=A0A1Y2GB29_9FUNG|nr:hypothetical protein BCR41DRAFT_361486 [Lobosporangium transversale]KAF9910370.1 hypothetical protein BX616_010878 [Lobosporangium transversale]ORZ05965.1 hypothetical protein BCR41DRAFT_361486 [Lobosporangium transversale]|eukprot:XP_021877346.1 hypothetical protein BCR41DRAFT_361486 [Lobosporangium transversale]
MSFLIPIGRSCVLIPRSLIRHNMRCISFSAVTTKHHGTSQKKNTPNSSSSTIGLQPQAVSTKTTAAKQLKNPFATPSNSVVAYVGPYAGSLRQCKSVAFVFAACGCIAIPTTLFLGNTEHFLAIVAGVISLSPLALLHALFRNNVTKIHVQGSASSKVPAAIKVSSTDPLKLTFEKLSWRGVPLQSQVFSTDLFVQSESDKSVVWTTTSATTPLPTSPSTSSNSSSSRLTSKSKSKSGPKPTSVALPQLRKETYRIDKQMMRSNPSFAFIIDQIEYQSRLSHNKYTKSDNSAK